MSGSISGLYAITPECPDTEELLRKVSLALDGGASAVQYRSKHAPHALRRAQAGALRQLCRARVPFIVNDDIALAKEIDADGVHLGRGDALISESREVLGAGRMIGASCYDDLGLALQRRREGADYVAFGSFYPTVNKASAVPVALSILREAKLTLSPPVVAIGGIRLENARQVIDAGANAVAVISGLFDTRDISGTARQFVQLFGNV
jgi:thiamine-phosphate pyrophosphorylase